MKTRTMILVVTLTTSLLGACSEDSGLGSALGDLLGLLLG